MSVPLAEASPDLSTRYLGLKLRSPIVASASPITRDPRTAVELERAGVAAIVLPSLFEEEIVHEALQLNAALQAGAEQAAESLSYFPRLPELADAGDRYLHDLERVRSHVSVPVIASLNASSHGGWVRYARLLEEAGADAIELNLYHVAADAGRTAADIEENDLAIIESVRAEIAIPLAVK